MAQKQLIVYDRTTALRGTPHASDDLLMGIASQEVICSGISTLQADEIINTAASSITLECEDIRETAGVWSRLRTMTTTATLSNVATNVLIERTASLTRLQARVYGVSATGTNIFDVDCSVIGPIFTTGVIPDPTPVVPGLIEDAGTTVTVVPQFGQTSIRVQGPIGVDLTWYLDITTTSMGT